ncbi:paralemmin 1a isoform 2-T2 [Pholidichthys leucotaenia]
MEGGEVIFQQDRQQLLSEKRKWLTEMENKRRQLEDDRRALQHLKSKALRERWLLDGASAGPEQDEVRGQLEQDEARTRNLEENISRLEQELASLESGAVCQTITHTTVISGSVPAVKVHKNPEMSKPRDTTEEMKKVVHEMNGEDGVHLLSSSEVEELIHKADEASMMSQTVTTVTSLPTAEVHEEEVSPKPPAPPRVTAEITGLEANVGGQPNLAEASEEKPVTMVFMGYQSVEDEDETKKVLGLQGTVKAELVLIDDTNGEKDADPPPLPPAASTGRTTSSVSAAPPSETKPKGATASNGEKAGEEGQSEEGVVEVKKKKQPCKCCSIM